MSVGEPDNDSRIAAFWKRFPNVLKWYQYADSLLGNLSGWEARINLAILRNASDEEAAQRYVTQMSGKMFADYAVPSIHAWAVVLQICEVVRPGVFRSIRQIARAACEPTLHIVRTCAGIIWIHSHIPANCQVGQQRGDSCTGGWRLPQGERRSPGLVGA